MEERLESVVNSDQDYVQDDECVVPYVSVPVQDSEERRRGAGEAKPYEQKKPLAPS